MIPDIKEKQEAIKKIWLENKEEMKTSQIYKQFLGDYFNVADWNISQPDWLFFIGWVRDWKKAIKKKEDEEEAKEMMKELTDEEVEKVQSQNRKRMIVMLSNLITNYGKLDDPIRKAFNIAEIRRMYSSIQMLEERMKMTNISRGKLKLEAVRTLLPYQRMSLPEILELKEKLNESFDRIVKLKSGEPVGADAPVNG